MHRAAATGLALALAVALAGAAASVRAGPDEAARDAARIARFERLLGEPCGTPVERDVTPTCGTRGRIAMVELPVDYLPFAPRGATRLYESPPANASSRLPRLTVDLTHGRLWVFDVTCGACRRVMGSTFIVDLAAAPDDALRALQARLGLAEDPVLRTEAAWRAALAARPSP